MFKLCFMTAFAVKLCMCFSDDGHKMQSINNNKIDSKDLFIPDIF